VSGHIGASAALPGFKRVIMVAAWLLGGAPQDGELAYLGSPDA